MKKAGWDNGIFYKTENTQKYLTLILFLCLLGDKNLFYRTHPTVISTPLWILGRSLVGRYLMEHRIIFLKCQKRSFSSLKILLKTFVYSDLLSPLDHFRQEMSPHCPQQSSPVSSQPSGEQRLAPISHSLSPIGHNPAFKPSDTFMPSPYPASDTFMPTPCQASDNILQPSLGQDASPALQQSRSTQENSPPFLTVFSIRNDLFGSGSWASRMFRIRTLNWRKFS